MRRIASSPILLQHSVGWHRRDGEVKASDLAGNVVTKVKVKGGEIKSVDNAMDVPVKSSFGWLLSLNFLLPNAYTWQNQRASANGSVPFSADYVNSSKILWVSTDSWTVPIGGIWYIVASAPMLPMHQKLQNARKIGSPTLIPLFLNRTTLHYWHIWVW